jgi:two-component system, OmpR family, sensor kinase
MKIFKSIKWRLQMWYGFSLVIIMTAMTATDYQLEHARQFDGITTDMNVGFQNIMEVLRRPPPRRDDQGQPPPDMRPPGDQMPDGPGSDRRLQFSMAIDNFFKDASTSPYYYAIWGPEGRELKHTTNAPADITMPLGPGMGMRGTNYEMAVNHIPPSPDIPPGSILLVGMNIARQLDQLHRHLLNRIGIGALTLFCLFCFGWAMSAQALKPIKEISATAVKISAGDLSQRINTAETESELGQLAVVLNSTFARLEAAFAQQKQFASDAAHELRTPISVILTQTQTALNRERSAPEYKQTVEACQRAAQRMRRLITALLELARLDAGQEQMKHLRFEFSKTVGDCVDLIRPLADERGVKVSSELLPVDIEGDSDRLMLVITNLLTNAVQYNHDGGQVKVGAKLENGMAVLTVSDTGQGIAAEDLPRIFERFYRADKSRSSGNAGLGLAISKALVEAHGGSIDVVSEENVGTTFTVRLPTVFVKSL